MYKIDDLSDLLENLQIPKLELPLFLSDFVKFLKKVDSKLQKINKLYSLEFNSLENEQEEEMISFVLKYKDKEIYAYTSEMLYYKYLEMPDYQTELFHNETGKFNFHLNLKEQVSIYNDPGLYKEIIEDQLIKSILNNENQNINKKILKNKLK